MRHPALLCCLALATCQRCAPFALPMYMSSREPSGRAEELTDKINKLRIARGQGKSYEDVVGGGKTTLDSINRLEDVSKDAGRQSRVFKGNATEMESELTTGRRTLVPEDAGVGEGEIYDVMDRLIQSAEGGIQSSPTAGFGTTMADAENFFRKQSPLDRYGFGRDKSAQQTTEEGAESGGETSVPAADAGDKGAAPAAAAAVAGSDMLTGSVGGKWSADASADVETHKPAVSTWGVFERPKDISRAYGGGRNPLLSGNDPELQRKREQQTKELLSRFRGAVAGADPLIEAEATNGDALRMALAASQRAMRFGDTFGALDALENVADLCSPNGLVGSQVLLELGMAYEATGQSFKAQALYKTLGRSRNDTVKRAARRLNLGLEAIDTLRFERDGGGSSEMNKIWEVSYEQMAIKTDKRYSNTYFETDKADGKPSKASVYSTREAKELLRAAVRYGKGGISSFRVLQALRFLRQRADEAAELQQRQERAEGALSGDDSSEGAATQQQQPAAPALLSGLVGDLASVQRRMEGSWRLGINAKGDKIEYGSASTLRLSGAGPEGAPAVFLTTASGPFSTTRRGVWRLSRLKLVCTYDNAGTWNPLANLLSGGGGGGEGISDIIALDDDLLLTLGAAAEAGQYGYSLWVRG